LVLQTGNVVDKPHCRFGLRTSVYISFHYRIGRTGSDAGMVLPVQNPALKGDFELAVL
jgi:hypothetical protein